jgi:hypothetical protein
LRPQASGGSAACGRLEIAICNLKHAARRLGVSEQQMSRTEISVPLFIAWLRKPFQRGAKS